MITQNELKALFRYDEETGEFYWRVGGRRCQTDKPAGTLDNYGYRVIRIRSRGYKASRLAWLYVYGEWPVLDLDHINRDKLDNRIENLRLATGRQNRGNILATKLGVYQPNDTTKWRAAVGSNWLGTFATQEEAEWAYMRAHAETYGEFSPYRTMFT